MGRLKKFYTVYQTFILGLQSSKEGIALLVCQGQKYFECCEINTAQGPQKIIGNCLFSLKHSWGDGGSKVETAIAPILAPPPHNHESSSSPGGTVPVQCFVCFNSLWLGHLQKKAKLSHITGWHSCLLVLRNHSILLYIWILKFA